MALVRWEPLRELAELQNELSRYMSQAWRAQGGAGDGDSPWVPVMDAWEAEGEIVLAVELPGLRPEDVSIEVEGNVLTVSGHREKRVEEHDDRSYRFERRYGSFARTVTLPHGVKESDIRADFRDGILEVHIPRPAVSRATRIPIGESRHSPAGGEPVAAA